MLRNLEGTVSLVTGASSGIGAATAPALAANGAKVAIAARRGDRLSELKKKIEAAGGAALAIEIDITNAEAARGVVEKTVLAFGRLDTLINNAGVMLLGPIRDGDPHDWQRMIDLNVVASMHGSRAALPHLLAAAEMNRCIADAVLYVVTRPRHVAVNEMLVRPTEQAR